MKPSKEYFFDQKEMKQYRITPPSPELKDRILDAGRAAWSESASGVAEVSWVPPVLRLAACLIVALTLVGFGNTWSEQSTAKWAAFDGLTDTSAANGAPVMSPLINLATTSFPTNPSAEILNRQRQLQEMLKNERTRNG